MPLGMKSGSLQIRTERDRDGARRGMKGSTDVKRSSLRSSRLCSPATARGPATRSALDAASTGSDSVVVKTPRTGRVDAQRTKQLSSRPLPSPVTPLAGPVTHDTRGDAPQRTLASTMSRGVHPTAHPGNLDPVHSSSPHETTLKKTIPRAIEHSLNPAASTKAPATKLVLNPQVKHGQVKSLSRCRVEVLDSATQANRATTPNAHSSFVRSRDQSPLAATTATRGARAVNPVWQMRKSPSPFAVRPLLSHSLPRTGTTSVYSAQPLERTAKVFPTATATMEEEVPTSPKHGTEPTPRTSAVRGEGRAKTSPSTPKQPLTAPAFAIGAHKAMGKKTGMRATVQLCDDSFVDTAKASVGWEDETTAAPQATPPPQTKPKLPTVPALDEEQLRNEDEALGLDFPLALLHTSTPCSLAVPLDAPSSFSDSCASTMMSSVSAAVRHMSRFRFPYHQPDSGPISPASQDEIHDCRTYVPAAFMSSCASTTSRSITSHRRADNDDDVRSSLMYPMYAATAKRGPGGSPHCHSANPGAITAPAASFPSCEHFGSTRAAGFAAASTTTTVSLGADGMTPLARKRED